MRQPTSDPYAWWRRALAEPRTTRFEDEPQAGFYRRRVVRNGPFLPVEIRLRQVLDAETGDLAEPEVYEAEELGGRRDPYRIWTSCRPISREEFEALTERHHTVDAMAATHVAVDANALLLGPGE